MLRAIGSIVVTVPSVWYLLQPDPNKKHMHGHGHGHGDEGHEEHEEHEEHGGETGEGEEAPESEKSEGSAGEEGERPEGKEEDESHDTGSEGGDQPKTPETSDDEGSENVAHEKGKKSGGNVEGVQFKGATKAGDEANEQTDTRKHIPDAKGYNKLRIESDYGKRQGVSDEEDGTRDEEGRVKDQVRLQLFGERTLCESCLRFVRLLLRNLQKENTAFRRNKKDYQIPTPSIHLTSQTTQKRARKGRALQRLQNRKEQWIQGDRRSNTPK